MPRILGFHASDIYCSPPSRNASIWATICGVAKWFIQIAPPGQKPPQVPQPLHLASVTCMTCRPSFSTSESALYGQRLTHIPQPAHFSSMQLAKYGASSTSPLWIGILAADAAPSADATVSGISFGPWQTPARKTPAVVVPHGFSFGCASSSQPSMEQETPKSFRVRLVSSLGW